MWTELWSRLNWVVFVGAVAVVAWAWAALLSKAGDLFEKQFPSIDPPRRPLPWVELPKLGENKNEDLFPRSDRVNTSAVKTTQRSARPLETSSRPKNGAA